ncbi:MAG: HypC/HybG/HupF family hydrogenase formation chaperone [Methylocystis sp.]|jgi:hydrogenase expression/formation protein HypC
MCLAIPARVIELLPDEMARVSLDGVVVNASVALVEDVAIGDYVVLHVGYALAKIDEDEALRTLSLLREAALLGADA